MDDSILDNDNFFWLCVGYAIADGDRRRSRLTRGDIIACAIGVVGVLVATIIYLW